MYHLKYLTIMSLNYSIAMMGNPLKKEEPKKAYAKAQTNGELSLKELSTLIASKCTVHQADVSAVLIATTECMLEGLKAGKQVNFGDLGAFRLQINSGGAPSADLFTSDYIKGVNIQFVPGEELQVIFQGLKFNLVPTRAAQAAVIKAQKAGKTTVDISGKNGSSDSESLLRDLRSLSHPNSLRSDRDAPDARFGLFALRPSAKAVQRKASLSSYILRGILILNS